MTLAIAVKELVENSLDAGAKVVEVRIWDHGTTRIEVKDDGAGVPKEDYQALSKEKK